MTTPRQLQDSLGLTAPPTIGTEPKTLSYSIPTFCRLTSLSRTTVYEAIKAGRLKVAKVGSRTIILSEDAQAFLRGARDGE